ncbi:hypothetical protein GH714_020346 [Hevea brasiliensis]|uniref:NAC domain-containing protein n=1 Tax=Hevea brasiliensis TaxID=3981 RepID=A0A6A6M305_HEVBR|nr:hypothetical protein GH714_020346 [Hevea brasiliensis]
MACSDSYQMTSYSSFNAGETSWSENQATYNGILQQEATELAPYPESFHGWTGQNCISSNWPVPPEAEQGQFYDINRVTKMMTSTISPSESAQEVGAGFRPKEKELVNHFLKLKLLGHDHQVRRIPELDVYKREPWDLPQYSVANSSDEEWYFFHHYRSGRPSRTTKVGYWKNTGRKRKLGTNRKRLRAFVLCKLFKKHMPVTGEVELSRKMAACNLENQNSYQKTNNSAFDEGETSQLMTFENQATDFAIQEEVHSQPTPHLGPFYCCNEQNYDLNSALNSPMQDFTCDDLCNEQNYNLNSALNSPMQDFTCDDLWDFSVDALSFLLRA